MDDLIDRDVLIADIRQQGILGSGYSNSERENDIVDMIESQNIVDAVHVVRCKDCKWFGISSIGLGWCNEVMARPMRGEYYCSFGERKEQG